MKLISIWIFKFLTACAPSKDGPAVTEQTAPMVAQVWDEGLEDVPTEALEPTFKATLRASKWFPTVADIRQHVECAEDTRSEDEWHRALAYAREWCHPDGIIAFGATRPILPSDIDHAIRAAGGGRFLWGCSEEQLIWAKKAFLEDLKRQRNAGHIAPLLGPSEFRKVLSEAGKRATLLPSATATEAPAIPPPAKEISAPPKPTEEEIEARRLLLEKQRAEVMRRFGKQKVINA